MLQSEYEVADVYTDLRNQVLALTPDGIGFGDAEPTEVIAILMETGYADAVATLVAVVDGTASMYFSNGGGVVGAGEHDAVRETAFAMLLSAQDYVQEATLTEEYPLPGESRVRFYLVTAGGVYTFEAAEDDLGYERHPCSPMFHRGHALITAIREHSPE